MHEFEIIQQYFSGHGPQRDDVVMGIGDDAAILSVPPGMQLAASVDSLVAGVHFPEHMPPAAVGHRSLAVNLSDLAAMGAQPAWALLALTLPQADDAWLLEFSRGFFALARRCQVALVGGNLALGPLNITIAVHGLVPGGQALLRSGARPGDHIYVSGWLGDAARGLQELPAVPGAAAGDSGIARFCYPEPRLQAGMALRGIASAAIDVSDGLAADLDHILQASGTGARLQVDALPLSPWLLEHCGREQAVNLALTGGDDYELCFTVPAARLPQLNARLQALGAAVTRVGEITAGGGLQCVRADGTPWPLAATGYQHF
ncbi:MAG: thiamine-phosphate kinase [Gammaproteobacteria bacterium]|nr:thiamine-phosphate kinase [Gammaproteobacteria bacterium]MDE2345177.1 thiamine-phosphate kinase [Gammaproteobacteria bacterium]